MSKGGALALEQFLEGKGLIRRRPGEGGLLTGSGARLLRASDLPSSSALRPVGESPLAPTGLERLLGGRLEGFIEIIARRSSGRFSIALSALAGATGSGQDAALVDLGDQLDPQAAQRQGVDLERLFWVRPRKVKQALAAAEMLLSTGFRLVVADMGLSPRGVRFLPDAVWVRITRAAKAQGSTLLLLGPYRMSGIAADAVVSVNAARPIWQGSGHAPRLLAGISSRLTLEKLGRETPDRAVAMTLAVPEAIVPSSGQERSRLPVAQPFSIPNSA